MLFLVPGISTGTQHAPGGGGDVTDFVRGMLRARIAHPIQAGHGEGAHIALERAPALFSEVGDSLSRPVPFEGYDPDRTTIRWEHAVIVGAALAGTVTAIHIYQRNAWWSDQRGPFHFVEDGSYALNVDKAGHVFGGAFGAFIGRTSLEWSGFSNDAALFGGAAIGALFELYVEFEDGFARDWGFSPGDAYADVIGAAWPIVQHYITPLQHVNPKFSYWPSKKFRDGLHDGNAIDDYEGQTYWVGIHMHGLLPASMRSWWPEWLGLAVGVSVRNMDTPRMERNVILALDYDMTKIVPGDSWWLHALKKGLNFIHFPSPGIRISPSFVGYGLYF